MLPVLKSLPSYHLGIVVSPRGKAPSNIKKKCHMLFKDYPPPPTGDHTHAHHQPPTPTPSMWLDKKVTPRWKLSKLPPLSSEKKLHFLALPLDSAWITVASEAGVG